jgi:hypothetical protein
MLQQQRLHTSSSYQRLDPKKDARQVQSSRAGSQKSEPKARRSLSFPIPSDSPCDASHSPKHIPVLGGYLISLITSSSLVVAVGFLVEFF